MFMPFLFFSKTSNVISPCFRFYAFNFSSFSLNSLKSKNSPFNCFSFPRGLNSTISFLFFYLEVS